MSIKRYAITAIVILILGMGANACKKAPKEPEAPPLPPTPPPPTTQSYSSTEHGFALEAPVEWEKKENEGDALVVFVSPAEGPDDKFQEMFSVSVDDKSTPKTLDQYITQTLNSAKKAKKGFKGGTPETASVGGVEGKVVTVEYQEGDNNLKVVQWFILKDQKVYILKGTALAETYDGIKPKFDEILASFKFSGPPPAETTGTEEGTSQAPGAGTGGN